MNPHQVTKDFEDAIAEYTGSPYCVCLDNGSNALFLALKFYGIKGTTIALPKHTYMSVPCEVIHAGGKVTFYDSDKVLIGCYRLFGSNVIDSALHFTADMYIPGTFMCCSFTGPYKHINTGKGGCILTDNKSAHEWFKRARYSGRNAVSYHDDTFTMTGWNFYMSPIVAAAGLLQMGKFYDIDGNKKSFPDVAIKYPDLSKFECYVSKER